jgi:hypothetical protein
LVLSRKNNQKPSLLALRLVAIFAAKKEHSNSLHVGVRAGLVGVVVPATGCIVEHLDD